MSLKVACILLARGGSKGLPRKNIRKLAGHPLIAYTIVPLRQSKWKPRVILSTDDPEIAAVAKDYGAEVPFIRPSEVAQDFTSSEDSLKHGLVWLKENENYSPDILLYLQVTDLFKDVGLIDQCIDRLAEKPGLDSVFVGAPDKKNYWKFDQDTWQCLTPGKHMSRQLKPPVFREDTGLACATRPSLILDKGRRLGDQIQLLSHDQWLIDVHTEFDFWLAEKCLSERPEFQKYRL